MTRRTVIILCCTCVAIAGSLVLVSTGQLEQPIEVPVGQVAELPEDTPVRTGGRISMSGLKDLGEFSSMWLVGDDEARVRVFMAFPPMDLGPGDRVRVVGRVALFEGNTEITVDSREDVELMERNSHPETTLGEVLIDPAGFVGSEPVLTVQVDGTPVPDGTAWGSWVVLSSSDGGRRYSVMAWLGEGMDLEPFVPGEELTLTVRLRYEPAIGLVYLEVTGIP